MQIKNRPQHLPLLDIIISEPFLDLHDHKDLHCEDIKASLINDSFI